MWEDVLVYLKFESSFDIVMTTVFAIWHIKLCLAATSLGPMYDLSVPCSFIEMPKHFVEYTTFTLCVLGVRGVQ